jgi:hypothetical protein
MCVFSDLFVFGLQSTAWAQPYFWVMTSHSNSSSGPRYLRHPRQGLPTALALVWIFIGLSSVASCKKDPANQSVEAAPAAPAPTPLSPGADLMSQLAAEAAHRPAGTTTIEQLVAALGEKGIALASFQQSIARTHGASYCGNVRSAQLYVFICEYPGAGQLAAGTPLTEAVFRGVPDHSLLTTRNTSVMLQALTPAGAAQAQQASAIISGL